MSDQQWPVADVDPSSRQDFVDRPLHAALQDLVRAGHRVLWVGDTTWIAPRPDLEVVALETLGVVGKPTDHVCRLPFADASFDAIVLAPGLGTSQTLATVLAGVTRAAKVGGHVLFTQQLAKQLPLARALSPFPRLRGLDRTLLGWTPRTLALHAAALAGLELVSDSRASDGVLVFSRRDAGFAVLGRRPPPRRDPLMSRCLQCGSVQVFAAERVRCDHCRRPLVGRRTVRVATISRA